MKRDRQWILVDADDTLWENNIYFERAIDRFIGYLDHPHLTHAEVRQALNEVELANAVVHGYGTASFGRNLQETFLRLSPERVEEKSLAEVVVFAHEILEHPMEVIDGVRETLAYLSEKHHLALFTKGDADEQHSKVKRSGLADFFDDLRVVREKNADAYRTMCQTLTDECQAHPDRVWMVGNSPRSDINPALAAGLNAVWVPHDATWVLEHEEVVPGPGKLLLLSRFADLQDYF